MPIANIQTTYADALANLGDPSNIARIQTLLAIAQGDNALKTNCLGALALLLAKVPPIDTAERDECVAIMAQLRALP